MKNIRYICCQPAITYYTWQVEVVINNFKRMGVNPNLIDIVCSIHNDEIPEIWKKMQNHYNTVRFFFYNDTRGDTGGYIPSIYFNLMKQHIAARPEIMDDVLFLHDSDVILTRPPQFNDMIDGDTWYLSDTNSYINYDYIQQKGNDIYLKMCEIVGLDPEIPKSRNEHSGGAQYIVKNTTFEFWDKVEKDSIKLYKYFCEVEPLYKLKHEGDYPIQKWTAGMWAFLWNGWYFGHEILVDPRMGFGWVTNDKSDIETYSILHNSGVVDGNQRLFYKGAFINELPYGKKIDINENNASYFYWQEICRTAENTILL